MPVPPRKGTIMGNLPKKPVNWSNRAKAIGFGTVAAIAGIVSYWHMFETIRTYTSEVLILAILVPISVDGLMLVSMIEYKLNKGRGVNPSIKWGKVRAWYRFRFWPAISTFAGLTVSGAANAASSDWSGPIAILEGIWPVTSLFLAMQSIKNSLVKASYQAQSAQAAQAKPKPVKATNPTKRATTTKADKATPKTIVPEFTDA